MNNEKQENELTYQIPRNVIARFELLPGIGWKQILVGGVCFLLAAGFWEITGFIQFPLPVRLFLSVLIFGGPIVLSIPNPSLGNISFFDKLIKAYRFSKAQKQYHFRKERI